MRLNGKTDTKPFNREKLKQMSQLTETKNIEPRGSSVRAWGYTCIWPIFPSIPFSETAWPTKA